MQEQAHKRWRTPLVLVAGLLAVTGALLPVAGRVLGPHPSFLPAFFSAVVVLDALTAWLLLVQFRATGRPRLLLLGLAYVWALAVVLPHLLAFPGVVTAQGLLGAGPSTAPWLWTAWHGGFALLLVLAALPLRGLDRVRRPATRRRDVWSSVAAVLTLAAGCAVLATAGEALLPVVISATDYSRLSRTVGPWVLGAGGLAVLLTGWRARSRTGLEQWCVVVATAGLGDAVLTLYAGARFTVGWYTGRALSVVTAAVVLLALVGELTRLYGRLEASTHKLRALADTDALTGLLNRRAVLDSAQALVQQSGPHVVALVDIDGFKGVNDRLGHDAGDSVLFTVAGRMSSAVRPADLLGRYGGEEFLLLLPQSDLDCGRAVAERLRAAVAASPVRSAVGSVPMTVSVGLAAVEPGAGLVAAITAADRALYQAKQGGRNQVRTAGAAEVPAQRQPAPQSAARG